MFSTDTDLIHRPSIDLSEMGLGLVGGHRRMHRSVLNALKKSYGLRYGIAILPMDQRAMNRTKLKQGLRECDLIAIVTGYASHTISRNN